MEIINGIYSAEDVASKLLKPIRVGQGWNACCPSHDNTNTAALSINDAENGKIVVFCHAGCTQQQVISALKEMGAWPEYKVEKSKKKSTFDCEYNYQDPHGEMKYQCVRWKDPKSFSFRAPVNTDKKWEYTLKNVTEFYPYRLPTIINSTAGICFTEGEKDADNLASLGFITTTIICGAKAWKDEYAQWFKGRRVYIIQDNDEAGEAGAKLKASKLINEAEQVKIIVLPQNGDKYVKDVSDWIENGGTKQQFIEIVKEAKEYGIVDVVKDEKFGEPAKELVNPSTGYIEWHDLNGKGKPLTTLETTSQLLQAYNIYVRYNVTKKEIEVTIPGRTWLVDNAENCALAEIVSLATRHGLSDGKIKQYLVAIADNNAYNPYLNWIESKPWDGISRLKDLYDTLDCQNEDQELAYIMFRRWMIGIIEANCNPTGISNSSVLVLQGEQYSGKTTWFWNLVDKNRSWGREACILNPALPDSVYQAVSYAIVELGELDATFRRADIAALKGFITKDFDRLRRPYAAADSQFPRRTVFFATVNPVEFLHDETGNRRFWTLNCGTGMRPNHGINVQQVMAEVKSLWDAGERHTMTKEEVNRLEVSNSRHEAATVIDELIEKYLHHNAKKALWEWKTATEVLLDMQVKNPSAKDRTACTASLRKRYEDSKFIGATRYYLVPPMKMSAPVFNPYGD